jgi:hypothetical protein
MGKNVANLWRLKRGFQDNSTRISTAKSQDSRNCNVFGEWSRFDLADPDARGLIFKSKSKKKIFDLEVAVSRFGQRSVPPLTLQLDLHFTYPATLPRERRLSLRGGPI